MSYSESESEEMDSSNSVSDSAYDEEEPYILRGKWCMDECKSLDECIANLEEFIKEVKQLQCEGYELRNPVKDDYGLLYKK